MSIPSDILLQIAVMKTILDGASYVKAGKTHGLSGQQAKGRFQILRGNLLRRVNRWKYPFETSWAVGLPACRAHKTVWLELIKLYEQELQNLSGEQQHGENG